MKKLITFAALAIMAIGTSASAQVYGTYSSFYSVVNTGGSCVSLSRDLYLGARGTDVRTLQSFLVSQNYPGSGTWMITGYYGQATAAAVRIYQQQRGLPVTGAVDYATRSSLNSGCG